MSHKAHTRHIAGDAGVKTRQVWNWMHHRSCRWFCRRSSAAGGGNSLHIQASSHVELFPSDMDAQEMSRRRPGSWHRPQRSEPWRECLSLLMEKEEERSCGLGVFGECEIVTRTKKSCLCCDTTLVSSTLFSLSATPTSACNLDYVPNMMRRTIETRRTRKILAMSPPAMPSIKVASGVRM